MKIRLLLALVSALLVSACATPIKPATATEADASAAYINAVENAAFGRATRVLWVHPPSNKDLEAEEQRHSRW